MNCTWSMGYPVYQLRNELVFPLTSQQILKRLIVVINHSDVKKTWTRLNDEQ